MIVIFFLFLLRLLLVLHSRSIPGRDRMVVGFITIYAYDRRDTTEIFKLLL